MFKSTTIEIKSDLKSLQNIKKLVYLIFWQIETELNTFVFWIGYKFAKNWTFMHQMHAIISRSSLEAALEYKPYIRPKVTVHKWSLEMG